MRKRATPPPKQAEGFSIAKIGTLYPKNSMFLRKEIGSGSGQGFSFEVFVLIPSHQPLVYCAETGKYFHLSLSDLVAIAVERGITECTDEQAAALAATAR